MARDINIVGQTWLDLVFVNKNKEYGAYELRSSATKRHLIAYGAIIVFVAFVMIFPTMLEFLTPARTERVTEVATFQDLIMELPEVKEENKVVAMNVPPPPALKTTIKFTVSVIREDSEVAPEEEMKTQDDLNKAAAAISVADVVGNDDDAGADIADLDDHKLVVEAGPDEVFTIVEEDPVFPGGVAAMHKWIKDHIRYPPVAEEMGISGKVYLEFVVGRDGAIRDIAITRGVDPSLDKEAQRVVSQMPKWIPGKQGGNPVSVKFNMPIAFTLQQQ
jgi:protein TonB